MQKLMGDEGWGGGPCFSLLTPSVCAFVNLTVLSIMDVILPTYIPVSMEFPIQNCLPFFFQTDGNFYQIILSDTQGRSPNKSLRKNPNVM